LVNAGLIYVIGHRFRLFYGMDYYINHFGIIIEF
jgi:hypothetical protein